MDIVVVLELDTPSNVRVLQPDYRPANPEDPVRRAHTAPAESTGACGPRTLCGLDTSDMTLAPHRSAHDRPRWHTCGTCQRAGGPGTSEPAAAADPTAADPARSPGPDDSGNGTGYDSGDGDGTGV
ncbi:hypothetical protein ACWEQL_28695 [Kitasatospora sp. NPDC004240]